MKIKLPTLKRVATPQWQKERLNKWLHEWSINKQLESEDINEEEIDSDSVFDIKKPSVADFDAAVEAGQVRLFSYDLLNREQRPRYFLVLGRWGDDNSFMLAPFSYMSEPATTGELDTWREHFSLKVLELWNARIAPEQAIAKSWVVDNFCDSELSDARSTYQHIAYGDELPEHLIERIGPPIINPADPRLEYQQQERSEMDLFEQACTGIKNNITGPISFSSLLGDWSRDVDEFVLAAADEEELRDRVFSVEGYELEIVVSEEPGSDDLVVNVYDMSGEPSHALDGATFIDHHKVIASITNTSARLDKSQVNSITTLDFENKSLTLKQSDMEKE